MSIQLTAIFRDEAPYLREWLSFHLLQGIDQIVLYNDRSKDNWLDVLQPFLVSGQVLLRTVPPMSESTQMWAYSDALRQCKMTWMGMWDVDEFLFPTKPEDALPDLLAEFDRPDLSMLNVCWLLFGANGHETQPEGLVMDNYTQRTSSFPQSPSFKSILKVQRSQMVVNNPHWGLPRPGYYGYDERGRKLPQTYCYPTESVEFIRLNHYYTKSREEWLKKVARGRADTMTQRDANEFDAFNALPMVEDKTILRYREAL